MSFGRFVAWCGLCGGWAAALGWVLGRLFAHGDSLGAVGLKGMALGLPIGLLLGFVDALWVFSLRQVGKVFPRVFLAATAGAIGGMAGGVAGQLLYDWQNHPSLLIAGWVLTGLLIGASIGTYEVLRCWVREEEMRWAGWRMLRGSFGGALGGALGGVVYWKLGEAGDTFFPQLADPWSPSLLGFIALGVCIGLLIAAARVVLKDAWLKVEAGFRSGRELMLDRPVLTIGRAESSDLGLFGDPQIEKLHARIYKQEGHFLIADNGSTHGTFVNDHRVKQPMMLRTGDLIRVGSAYLRFRERGRR
jgi:FHA domain